MNNLEALYLKKNILLILAVFALTVLLYGCGGTTKVPVGKPADLPQKIVVGLDDNFPPMGFRDKDGKLTGFDIEMAQEATKRLGITVDFKPIDWNSKEAELTSKRVDLLWNGLTITEKRKETILFSKPYMENRQIIIVKSGSPIKTKANLNGKIVGTQDGSTSVDAVEKEPAVLKSFKTFRRYGDFIATLMDLDTGRLDAVVIDEIVGRYYTAMKPGQYEVLKENFGTEEYGVGLRKSDTALLTALQKTLDEMKTDGASAKISGKWFGSDIVK
jgi:polar amino acid transport system substrate-binding protein